MRERKWDNKLKSFAQRKKELGKCCSVPHCGKPLSHVVGPGSEKFCREHQVNQPEYGGYGGSSLYSYHRKPFCEECGYNPSEDTKWKHYHYKIDDPTLFNRLCRNKLDVNHVNGNHEDNRPENLQTVCKPCHSDITILEQHYLSGRNKLSESND
jgi:hypothetical protein